MCWYGLRPAKQVPNRLTGRETLRSLSKLLGLDRAVNPTAEDLDHRSARLQALGSHRPDCIRSYVYLGIHHDL
jgi:hypothetical protein